MSTCLSLKSVPNINWLTFRVWINLKEPIKKKVLIIKPKCSRKMIRIGKRFDVFRA